MTSQTPNEPAYTFEPRRPRAKPPSLWVFVRRWVLRIAIVLLAFFAISIAIVLPLRWIAPVTSAFMLADDSGRDPLLYEWHDLEQISESAVLAAVAAEDQRFADHIGIDLKSIKEAMEGFEKGARLRGASTISQQVTKNLFLWNSRSYLRKGIEAYLTLVVELCLPKRRILEIYLNIAELGAGVYGFPSASQVYFGKSVADISDAQAARLAAALPNPERLRVNSLSPYMLERQRWIQGEMARLRREGWLRRLN